MTEHQYTAELTFTLPAFTLFSQAGGYVLSAHVLEERVPQKVEDWERAGEIVRVAHGVRNCPHVLHVLKLKPCYHVIAATILSAASIRRVA